MAFASSQLSLVRRLRGNFSEWNYRSTSDDQTVQEAANYFNGGAAQFRVGDIIVSYGAGTPQVYAVSANTGSVVTVTKLPGGGGGGTGGTVNDGDWLGTELQVVHGGTGGTNATEARDGLELKALAILDKVDDLNWKDPSGTPLAVAHGGTGGTTQATARTGLGLGTMAVLGSVDDTNWKDPLGAPLTVAHGGTGATTETAARANLLLGTLATLNNVNNANWTAGGADLTIANGGTGASTEAAARDNLLLGDLAVKDKVNNIDWDTPANAPLSVVNGGTGATTAANARTNLGISSAAIEAVSLALTGLSTNFTTVGDGINRFVVTGSMNGMNLVSVLLVVGVVGSSNVTVQIRRRRSGTGSDVDMLSTKLTTDLGERSSLNATTAAVINTANDDIGTGDVIYIDVDAITGTPQGGLVGLEFQKP